MFSITEISLEKKRIFSDLTNEFIKTNLMIKTRSLNHIRFSGLISELFGTYFLQGVSGFEK